MGKKEGTIDPSFLADIPPWEWPDGTDTFLLAALRDQRMDPEERLIAAELAGDYTVVNDEIFDTLLAIVADGEETEEIRAKAAIAMGATLEHGAVEEFDDPDDCPISEQTFLRTQESLRNLFRNADIPKQVRRYILEASVRAPLAWHQDAVRAAYSSGDEDWMLTAVFSIQWLMGFDDEILEALESENDDIFYQAVCAAGAGEIDAAWPYMSGIITEGTDDKSLLLAAIEAAALIRPKEAGMLLADLIDDDDEDIAAAAYEAITFAEGPLDADDYDDFDDYNDFEEDEEEEENEDGPVF